MHPRWTSDINRINTNASFLHSGRFCHIYKKQCCALVQMEMSNYPHTQKLNSIIQPRKENMEIPSLCTHKRNAFISPWSPTSSIPLCDLFEWKEGKAHAKGFKGKRFILPYYSLITQHLPATLKVQKCSVYLPVLKKMQQLKLCWLLLSR